MRRILATTVIAAALFLAAACGSDSGTEPGAGASGTAGNTNAVCDRVKEISKDSAKEVADAMPELLAAEATGDRARVDAAETKVDQALLGWADKLQGEAGNATDPAVRKDLTDLAAAMKKLVDDDQPEADSINEVRDRAGKVCG